MFTVSADSFMEFANVPTAVVINSIDVHIGRQARMRRTSLGMSEQELCKLLGVHRSNLAAHEAGAKRINAAMLLRIAKVLEVGPDYFFQGYAEEDWQAA